MGNRGLYCTIVILNLSMPVAYANSFEELLDTLRDNKTLNEQQYQRLLKASQEDIQDTDPAEQHQLKTRGGLELSTNDGQFSFELGGRLMVDLAFFDEDKNPQALGNASELRRARIEMQGQMYGDWQYEFDVDFADSSADIKDAYVKHVGNYPGSWTIGQHKEPFSLEELTSSKYLTFMERALPNEFAPGRNLGVSWHTFGEHSSFAAGVFGEAFDDEGKAKEEGWGFSARYTYAPYHSERSALHLGLGVSHRVPDQDHEKKFDPRPEAHLSDIKYANTDDITSVDAYHVLGFEFASVSGPFSIQAEYMRTEVDRASGLMDPNFSGAYIYLSYFITGEARNYNHKQGVFKRTKPLNKSGAWEIALRYSRIDLTDAGISGGKEQNITLGLNWYLNKRLRFMANYIRVDNDINADDAGGVTGNDDPTILQARMQLDF